MNFTSKFKKNKGITLIALVVTIIVLLVLAGVSIAMLTGQNGILKRTAQAKEETSNKQEEDLVRLAVSSALTDGLTQGNQITDENLRKEIKNAIGSDENLSGNGPWKYIGKKTYYISLNGGVGDTVNWDEVLENLQDASKRNELLNEAKSLGQSNTNSDVGIGTDGNVVNLDLWEYCLTNSGDGIKLQSSGGSYEDPGYLNSNITEDGKIQGEVPQYIFMYSKNKTYPVVSMRSTFYGCTSLKIAPIIPDSVVSMEGTFYGCTSLTTAPTIPNSVTDMSGTFAECTSLTTAPTIPNSVTNMSQTFMKCTSLTTAPTIPNSVTNMDGTFENCTSLTTAPTIPNSVTTMFQTFLECTSLTGNIVINANTNMVYGCFAGTIKPITLSGTSTTLQDLAETSSNNNVTVQTE